MTDRPVRILIADDHVLLRDGIKLMLEREPEFQVVGEAGDGVEALESARRTPSISRSWTCPCPRRPACRWPAS